MHDLRRSNRHPLILFATSTFATVVLVGVAARTCDPGIERPSQPAWDAGIVEPRDGGAPGGADAGDDASRVSDAFDDVEAITWPEEPRIAREVDAMNREQLEAAIATPATRVRVTGAHGGSLAIGASDVAIELADGASIERLLIAQGAALIVTRADGAASSRLSA